MPGRLPHIAYVLASCSRAHTGYASVNNKQHRVDRRNDRESPNIVDRTAIYDSRSGTSHESRLLDDDEQNSATVDRSMSSARLLSRE